MMGIARFKYCALCVQQKCRCHSHFSKTTIPASTH